MEEWEIIVILGRESRQVMIEIYMVGTAADLML